MLSWGVAGANFKEFQGYVKRHYRTWFVDLHLTESLSLKTCKIPEFHKELVILPFNTVWTIDANLNRGVIPSGPIRRQDTKIGGCHLAFFPITFVQGQGLNSQSSWKCDHFWIQPSPETASHNQGGSTHWYSSIRFSSMGWTHFIEAYARECKLPASAELMLAKSCKQVLNN